MACRSDFILRCWTAHIWACFPVANPPNAAALPLLQALLAADLRKMTVLSRKSSPPHVAMATRSTARRKSRDPNGQNEVDSMLQKENDHRSAAEKLAQAFQNPPSRPFGQHLRRDLEEYEVVFSASCCSATNFVRTPQRALDARSPTTLLKFSPKAPTSLFHPSDRCNSPFSARQISRCR